jgi:alkylation response protein AidB-like acyl-CoA dehydrogenase
MSNLSIEDRSALADMFQKLLADKASTETLRAVVASDTGYDERVWKNLAELGLLSLLIPSEDGGIGGDARDLQAIMERAGAVLFPSPYLSTAVFAARLLSQATASDLRTQTLNDISSGDSIVAVASGTDTGYWMAPSIVTAEQSGSTWHLKGTASFVIDAPRADKILVRAKTPSGAGVFCVPAVDVRLEKLPTDDPMLSLGHVSLDDVQAKILEGVCEDDITAALKVTLTGFAAAQAGAAQELFNRTNDYLKTRYQFGRQIGSYQALKHMAADLLIEVESAVTVARQAAEAVAEDKPNAEQLVWLASFSCADTFRDVAAAAIQMHGGIAYTMEHDAHLFWRNARAGQWLYGTSDQFREKYLTTWETAA